MEEVALKIRVGSLLQLLQTRYTALDLGAVFDGDTEFDKRMKEFFVELFVLLQDADDINDVADTLEEQALFKIDVDINDLLYDWSGDLVSTLRDADALQLVNDYLARYNKTIYGLHSDNVTLNDLSILWGLSEGLEIQPKRFMALAIFYLITKAYSADVETFKDKLKAVEAFFYVRDYLVNDAEYPVDFVEDDLESLELKSLVSQSELRLFAQFKTLTAAGGVASALQREDLEGRRKKVKESSTKKKYKRIEKLE